jgi:hypothetical protein
MSLLHENRRLWQRHVLAETRRSIAGLLETLCDDPIYKIMATSATFKGRDQVAQFYAGLFDQVTAITPQAAAESLFVLPQNKRAVARRDP